MARLPKVGAATVAALFSLFVGVEVASAGLVDEVVEDPVAAVEAPVAEVTGAANDAAAGAKETADDVKETADDVAGQAAQTVDQATEAAGQVTEPVTDTAAGATNALEEVVDSAPAGKVVDEVERIVAPVVENPVPQLPGSGSRSASGGSTSQTAPGGAVVEVGAPDPMRGAPSSGASLSVGTSLEQGAAATTLEQGAAALLSRTRQFGAESARDSSAGWGDGFAAPSPLLVSAHAQAENTPTATASRGDAPGLPWPFSPSFPLDSAAVASLVAGAAGGALIAALLAAFAFMAPSAGRWLRPGPTLARPDPCLSLAEQPG